MTTTEPGVGAVAQTTRSVLDELDRVIVGKRDSLELVIIGLLADGHVILEDLPGMAKTLTARLVAEVFGLQLARVQFTPDLLPADITGSAVLDHEQGRLLFQPGPLFANLLLGDEINRAPPKTQAAMLEAMQERQVTVDGETHPLPRPFNVLATQNPIEHEGTYPLPEAQLDRFLLRVRIGYPTRDQEAEILRRRISRRSESARVAPISTREELLALRGAIEQVHVAPEMRDYLVALAAATREHPAIEVGASPRATLALLAAARARAGISGRDYVIPDDAKRLAGPVLSHRVIVRPEMWARGLESDQVIAQCVEQVPVPRGEEAARGDAARET